MRPPPLPISPPDRPLDCPSLLTSWLVCTYRLSQESQHKRLHIHLFEKYRSLLIGFTRIHANCNETRSGPELTRKVENVYCTDESGRRGSVICIPDRPINERKRTGLPSDDERGEQFVVDFSGHLETLTCVVIPLFRLRIPVPMSDASAWGTVSRKKVQLGCHETSWNGLSEVRPRCRKDEDESRSHDFKALASITTHGIQAEGEGEVGDSGRRR
ncbi:hypothetical protein EDB83DRAFT_1447139 [Lactarius deliciosus]|nr:hypothetical protein EDB83DRAFT_1447139 [Lactarius deliciosus]